MDDSIFGDEMFRNIRRILGDADNGEMDEEVRRMRSTPMYMISELLASDPESKTYRACLDVETEATADSLSRSMSEKEAYCLKRILELMTRSFEGRSGVRSEIVVLAGAMDRVLEIVLERKRSESK